jgi:hypothetical protein
LLWINATHAKSVDPKKMEQMKEPQCPPLALQMQPASDRKVAAVSGAVTLVTVPAAWPAGVSALALAVNACQRRDFHLDWPPHSPKKIVSRSVFCD